MTAYVVDTSRSPHARLHPVPLTAVRYTGGFWQHYLDITAERSIPGLYRLFESKGIVDNFRRVSGRKDCPRRGPRYTDLDVYKWMEGAAYLLAQRDVPEVRESLDGVIDEIVAAQDPDGYLNTMYRDPAERFTAYDSHEFYCSGHYFQAALAVLRCLGDDRAYQSALRLADYLDSRCGPKGETHWASTHPEIELALVELYRQSGDPKHLEFAQLLLERLPYETVWIPPSSGGCQPLPFTQRQTLFGHAVRNMYTVIGATGVWSENGDADYGRTIRRLWNNLVGRQIYITGGVGSRYSGEMIGPDYELPNRLAYAETCAAIGFVLWAHHNLLATGEGEFADWLEQSLYNGVISGLALDGETYFYQNPLASFGDHRRQAWYDTTCCPTNMVRLMASLPAFFYSTDAQGVYVHLYDRNTLDWRLEDGTPIRLEQKTDYPWDGRVEITVNPHKSVEFTLALRVPHWSRNAVIRINGQPQGNSSPESGYLRVRRVWSPGDRVELELDMHARAMTSHPLVINNHQRLAVMRGPLVYCLESVDQPDLPVHQLSTTSEDIDEAVAEGLQIAGCGVIALRLAGRRIESSDRLYAPVAERKVTASPVEMTAIPYFAWANRGVSQMTVWVARP